MQTASRIARVEPLTTTRAVRGPFDYRLGPHHEDVAVGSLLTVPFARRSIAGVVTGLADTTQIDPDRLAEPSAVLPVSLPADLVSLASWMAAEYCSTKARALSLLLPPGATRAVKRRPKARRPAVQAVGARLPVPPLLTSAQAAVVEHISRAIASGTGERLLLHGVTGSGKTEVYLRAVAQTLEVGRSAIVLVPEIALTPQSVSRFSDRFGDVVAVLHSALSDGERRDEWRRLRSGAARVCVGPRSAVFAPLADIGLVVVDEEHDGSYKHEGDPRYDARAVAERRAAQHGAVLIAGTATPRPESYLALRRLRLAERVDGLGLPPVRVLDMRGHHHPLHPETRMRLADVRAAGGKAILLLNRRGWSNFLSCRACGRVWSCPDCDVALVLHRASGSISCHHCGHREPAPRACSACGSSTVARHGAGTERIEHDLSEALGPGFPVFRLDAEAARGKDQIASVLASFDQAPSGVLVGTQMVAKGHDFPDVTLGVVLDADQTLRFPDFRAEERTFALVTQLAGRAGRGPGGGEVLVQTVAPDADAIVYASRHDADGFLARELGRRELLRYPPYSTLIRIVCSSPELKDAAAVAADLHGRIADCGEPVLGPAPLFRLRAQHRMQLVVKAAARRGAIAAVGAAVDGIVRERRTRGVNISVDVDPQ
jgi:primosomal protein N' (replication factor Y)